MIIGRNALIDTSARIGVLHYLQDGRSSPCMLGSTLSAGWLCWVVELGVYFMKWTPKPNYTDPACGSYIILFSFHICTPVILSDVLLRKHNEK